MQSDQDMQSETILKDQFTCLIYQINAQDFQSIREITHTILHLIFCEKKNTNLYLSLLYKLIFHTYKHNPLASFKILSGFIEFGQSDYGNAYKPLIDYIVMEAFNNLFEEYGWATIKPCVIALREINYMNETLYKNIVRRIVKQLDQDVNEMPYSSELCYNLPREKSFTWGWFSYDIARAYYSILFTQKKEINAKQLRNIMMLYRKLLTKLRKNAINNIKIISSPALKIEATWESIINVLAEYQWANDFINETLTVDESVEAVPSEAVPSEAVPSEAQSEVQTEVQTEAQTEAPSEVQTEVQSEAPSEAEPEVQSEALQSEAEPESAEPELHPSEKNNSWLYKLFGW